MNNKLIRLTESDLHRIVEESVNRVLSEMQLNELDPRTYASYAQKRANQGYGGRAAHGINAAVKAWNKEYGSHNPNSYIRDKNGYEHEASETQRLYNSDDTNPYHTGKKITYEPWKEIESWEYDDNHNPKYKSYSSMAGLGNYGSKVARQMSDGSGTYVKGKGWQ